VALVATPLVATRVEAADDGALDTLKQQIQQLQWQVQQLQQKVADLESAKTNASVSASVATTSASQSVSPPPWSPAQSLTVTKAGPAYLNLSLVGDTVFGWSTTPNVEAIEGAHHDPSQRGFTLQGAELTLDGAVDPYFKALVTVPLVLEPGGATVVELEEAWVQTTSLPWNLQVKAGQMFANFGRQNPQHAHTWAFVDQPLVITRLLGADGLRNPGAQLSWLAPTPFYSEVMLGVFNSDGDTAASFRNDGSTDIHGGSPVSRGLRRPQDLMFVPRLAASFDLSDTQTLLVGLSGAFGPNNSGSNADTQIYGADIYWKWRPERAQAGFPFVSWQTEVLYRRYEAAERLAADNPLVTLPTDALHNWGFFSQLLWGFTRGWVAGLRGEFVNGVETSPDDLLRADRTRISPNLTWYPTEFSKLRLQYNYDHLQRLGDEHSVWLQLEFLIGAHAAHKF